MRMRLAPAAIVFFIAASAFACACATVQAAQIDDPENVTRMDTTVTQSGKILLSEKTGLASAEDLTLSLYVPQNDSRQESAITKVIGPDGFSMKDDGYGNTQIELTWRKPPLGRDIDYMVETAVSTDSGPGGEGRGRKFHVTDMIEADSGIIEAAYTAAGGKGGIEGALLMAAWVNENVEYDLSCEDKAYDAKWVFGEKRGTCDEFSVLLLSMMRAADYDAWYAAGYAYLGGRQEGETSFGSHAWVEARIDGKTYGIDPTWAESPLDATHITFARLPDANFTEHTSVRSRDVSLSWEKDETRIEAGEYAESPRVDVALSSFPEETGGEKHVMLTAALSAQGCILTSVKFSSCINDDGSDMLSIEGDRVPASFCGETEISRLAGTPQVGRGMVYTCPVTFSAGGARERIPVLITSKDTGNLLLMISTKKTLVAGERFTAAAGVSGRDTVKAVKVLAAFAGEKKEAEAYVGRNEPVSLDFSFTAPSVPGEYALSVLTGTGDLSSEKIMVVTEKTMSLNRIVYPSSLTEGDACMIDAGAANAGGKVVASLVFSMDDAKETRSLDLPAGGNASESYNCSALSPGRHALTLSLLDGEGTYQDSWTGGIEILAKPSVKEDVSDFLERFILGIIEAIRSLFG